MINNEHIIVLSGKILTSAFNYSVLAMYAAICLGISLCVGVSKEAPK